MKTLEQQQKRYQPLIHNIEHKVSIPTGYILSLILDDIQQNQNEVVLLRYTPTAKRSLSEQHFSVIIEVNSGSILGFTHMNTAFALSDKDQLPSEEQTKKIVQAFLQHFEPNYFEQLQNLWIDRHDETIIVAGNSYTISGMKYKCYIQDADHYTWLIVAKNGEIITMERGIIWDNGRVTEKWLHDDYLKEYLADKA